MNPTILVNAMNLLQQFEAEQITRTLPKFGPGDTVVVQAYEGVVIAKKNAGLSSAFTVRKMSHGTGVERVFQSHSQIIDSVVVKRRDPAPRLADGGHIHIGEIDAGLIPGIQHHLAPG